MKIRFSLVPTIAIAAGCGLPASNIVTWFHLSSNSSRIHQRKCGANARLRYGHSAAPKAPALWAELAKQYDGKDRWYLEALGIGVDGQWDRYLNAWLALQRQCLDHYRSADIPVRSNAR